MIFFSSALPCSVSRLSVTENLFRASERYLAPTFSPFFDWNMYSSRPKGVSFRMGSPPGGSTMMTSAPSSEKCEEHQWPISMFAVMSRTRIPSRDSGLSALNCCRTADSTHREYSFRFSSTPAYTSSTVGAGIAGHGRTLIVGRFFSVRHFSAMLPLLVIFTAFESLVRNRFLPVPVAGSLHCAVIAPLSVCFPGRRPLAWNVWADVKKPPKIGMFHGRAGVGL